MLIVAGQFVVAPDQRERFLESRAAAIRASRAEAGCLEYCFSADSLDPGVVRIFERWEDRASLDAHLKVVAARNATAPSAVEVLRRELVRYVVDEFDSL
jgi:quinol monooxygenase YgiN